MNKKTLVVVATIILAFVGLVVFANMNKKPTPNIGKYSMDAIKEMAEEIPSENINPDSVYEASETTGNLPEKTIGDPSTAKIVLYEYADYACSHCAEWSAKLDKMVKESDGKLAVVYRGYLLGFKNGLAAALAATAAQKQGYWAEYKELLFANQIKWADAGEAKLKSEIVSYFESASNGKGDVDQFLADMESDEVAQKIAFEYKLGKKLDIPGTPTFRVNGENLDILTLETTIKDMLAE